MLRGRGGKLQPQRGENAQLVAVAEEQHVTLDGPNSRDHPLRARCDVADRLATDDAVAEQRPSRPALLDLGAGHALVFAVVPLDQVGLHHGAIRESGQLAGFAGALRRTHEDGREIKTRELRHQSACLLAPFCGEREVAPTGVTLFAAPRGLAMAHDDDPLCRVGGADLHGARLYAVGSAVPGSSSGLASTTSQSRSATAAVIASGSCSRRSTQKWQWSS